MSNPVLFVLISTFLIFKINAQRAWPYAPTVGISHYNMGDGHGSCFSVFAAIYDGKQIWHLGPNIQKRDLKFNGIRLGYSRIVTGFDNYNGKPDFLHPEDKGRLQLTFFATGHYIHKGYLGRRVIEQEKQTRRFSSEERSVDNLTLRTYSFSAGFGLGTKILRNVIWSNRVGLNFLYHPLYVNGLNSEKKAMALMIESSLFFVFPQLAAK